VLATCHRRVWLCIDCQSHKPCGCVSVYAVLFLRPVSCRTFGRCAGFGQCRTCVHDTLPRTAQHRCCRDCAACALPRQEPAPPRPRPRLRWHGRWCCSAPVTMRLSPPRAGGTHGTASTGTRSRRRATAWSRSACWSRRHAPARRAPPRSRTRRRRAFGPAGTCRPPAWSVEPCQAVVGALAVAPLPPSSGLGLTLGRGRQARTSPAAYIRA